MVLVAPPLATKSDAKSWPWFAEEAIGKERCRMRKVSFALALALVPSTSFAGKNRVAEVPRGPVDLKSVVAKEATEAPRSKVEPKPAGASAQPGSLAKELAAQKKSAKSKAPKAPCLSPVSHFLSGTVHTAFPLTTCSGEVAPLAVEKLSLVAQPHWSKSITELATAGLTRASTRSSQKGVVDAGLALRLGAFAKRFGSAAKPAHFVVISGYRPGSRGSLHATAKAFDVRIEGVKNEALVEFCKTLEDTGCGYYPNSTFVHVDVRRKGAGHVSWIDISGPGEDARYVSTWPLKPGERAEPNVPTELVPKDLEDDGHGTTIEEIAPPDTDRAIETAGNGEGPSPLAASHSALDSADSLGTN